ncbi:MAG TPA: GNAT family N-acyltransferase [Burkholderiales bacterium]|nr:GNAT family N-acyltransferase [Burkholderiales bacterium]
MRSREGSIGTRILGTASVRAAYRIVLAEDAHGVRQAQRLRFEVFNLELGVGLARAYGAGLDEDEFDPRCDHLLLEHCDSGTIVSTYRLLPGRRVVTVASLYSATEFDLTAFGPLLPELGELGRACIQRRHRNPTALGLLWRGIAEYAASHGLRYLIGCSSLHTVDAAVGAALYRDLAWQYLAPERFRTRPRSGYACPLETSAGVSVDPPKLLSAYLSLGARICGAPAIDREFGSIDFPTVLDLETLGPRLHRYAAGTEGDT